MDSVFFDTNFLVYTADDDSPQKQERARGLLQAAPKRIIPVISTQVMQEFYNACTIKLKIDKAAAKSIVHDLRNMMVVQITPDMIEHGIDISISARLSFWDGLILAAADYAGCVSILSEDMNDGQTINGVKVINPFMHQLLWE